MCCGGQVVGNLAKYGCCEGALYERATHTCCSGTKLVERESGKRCCVLGTGTHWYDPKTEFCSRTLGRIKKKDDESNEGCAMQDMHRQNEPLAECCRRRIYNVETGTTTLYEKLSDGMTTKCCRGRDGSHFYIVATHVCCRGKVYPSHIYACTKTANGKSVSERLSVDEERKHWRNGETIGKRYFMNTQEFLSMVEIKVCILPVTMLTDNNKRLSLQGIHLPEHGDISSRHDLLRKEVAPGGRYLIGYFDITINRD